MDIFGQTNNLSELEIFPRGNKEYQRFMITHLFLPFLFFKVIAFDLFTLEHDSTTHNVVGVVHGIFQLDFGFEVCDFSVQPFQLEGENTVFSSVLIWPSIEEGGGGG